MSEEKLGTNPDPRRRRWWKAVLLIGVLALAGVGAVLLLRGEKTETAETAAQQVQQWYCPMHPHIISDKPGNCPICRMELVPRKAAAAASPTPSDTMKAASETSGRRILYWYDPMAPGSKFDKPGKSPFMDMELVPKYADEEAPATGSAGAPAVSLSPQAIRATGIATAPVTRQNLSHTIRAVGTIEAAETKLERVAARVPGRIENLHADFTGQEVRRGAPLYELYSPDLVATQREYLLALEHRRRLSASGTPEAAASAGALVEAAHDRLRLWGISQAQIEKLEKTGRPDLSLTFVSPISGTVLQKNVVEGQYVQEGTELYLLADLSSVWLIAQVYEFELGKLKEGERAAVTVSAYPGRQFTGRIAFIEPVLERETRTARVRVVLPNPRGDLKPGMFADAQLEVPLGEGLSAPKSAVIDTGARRLVYVETSPGTFVPREVTLGSSAGDRVVVLEGLKEGERVVAAANFFIDSQAQLSGGASVQWSGSLDVKSPPPTPARGPGDRKAPRSSRSQP